MKRLALLGVFLGISPGFAQTGRVSETRAVTPSQGRSQTSAPLVLAPIFLNQTIDAAPPLAPPLRAADDPIAAAAWDATPPLLAPTRSHDAVFTDPWAAPSFDQPSRPGSGSRDEEESGGPDFGRVAFDGAAANAELAALQMSAYRRLHGTTPSPTSDEEHTFVQRNRYMDQFDASIDSEPSLRLFADSNLLVAAGKLRGDQTRASLYALSSGHAFHIPPAVQNERLAGHSAIAQEKPSSNARLFLNSEKRLQVLFNNVLHAEPSLKVNEEYREKLVDFFRRNSISRKDSLVLADVFLSCPPPDTCALVTFDRGFQRIGKWTQRTKPDRPTKLEREFQELVESFPEDLRRRIGRSFPRVVVMN